MKDTRSILETAEKLYQKEKKKLGRGDKSCIEQFFAKYMTLEQLSWRLETEGEVLWRFAAGADKFTKTRWKNQIETIWKYKKTFPVLYHVKETYDKREVVMCLLITSGLSMAEADECLEACSTENPSYYVRPLYPLHYKEGFFRLLLRWNDKHEKKLTFRDCIELYEDYEKHLVACLADRWKNSEQEVNSLQKENRTQGITYYYQLAQKLGDSMIGWELPLSLERQDELQRMIVLQVHLERALEEKRDICSCDGITAANSRTRKRKQRGTIACLDLAERLSAESRIEEALRHFAEEGIRPMGEACWRAVSLIMREYGKSGRSGYENTPLFRERILSNRNKAVKQLKKVSLFEEDEKGGETILSFALDVELVKEKVRSQTGNTVLIAQVLQPEMRNGDTVFRKSSGSASQTALSLFLNEYLLWCKGKTGIREFGGIRHPLPFYRWNRREMIDFALACGVRTSTGLNPYMELLGWKGFRPVTIREEMVESALNLCEGTKNLPIPILLKLQSYVGYITARDVLRRMPDGFDATAADKGYRFWQRFQWYDIALTRAGAFGKTKVGEIQFGIIMMSAALIQFIQNENRNDEEKIRTEQELLRWLFEWETSADQTAQESPDRMGQITFSEYMENLNGFGTFYAEELADMILGEEKNYDSRKENGQKKQQEMIEGALIWTMGKAAQIDLRQYHSAGCLKTLYDQWFAVMGGINKVLGDNMGERLKNSCSSCMKMVEEYCIYWVFWGGTLNFSIGYYEKRFHLNHFAKDKRKTTRIEGSRWFKSIQELEEDLTVWHTISGNVRLIKNCYCRMSETEDIRAAYQKFLAKVNECKETLKEIIEYLTHGMTEAESLRYGYERILETL